MKRFALVVLAALLVGGVCLSTPAILQNKLYNFGGSSAGTGAGIGPGTHAVGDGSAADSGFIFDADNDFWSGYDQSDAAYEIGYGGTFGTTPVFRVSTAGVVGLGTSPYLTFTGDTSNVTVDSSTGGLRFGPTIVAAGVRGMETDSTTSTAWVLLGTATYGRLALYKNNAIVIDLNPNSTSVLSITNVMPGTTGGITFTGAEATVTLSGASGTIQTNVPTGALLIGVQLRVDTAITSGDGATSWSAAYTAGGASQAICSGQAFTKNTKANKFFDYNANTGIASAEVDITITPNANTFSGGVIRAIVSYREFTAMGDAS